MGRLIPAGTGFQKYHELKVVETSEEAVAD
jgi:hypothetical protein